MAYFDQQMKQARVPAAKKVLKKYGMRASFAVRHHSTFICNIKSGPLDIIGNMQKMQDQHAKVSGRTCTNISVNTHWIDRNYDGQVRDFLRELTAAMNTGNHDNSDIMTDYFDVGFYLEINVGQWDMPYQLTD
jgi:hypothetical protein